MAFDPSRDYAGKSSTPGKAGGYSGGGGGKSFGGGQGIAAARNLPSPMNILSKNPMGAQRGLSAPFFGGGPTGMARSSKDFFGSLSGPGPAQMGMPTSRGPGGIMGRLLPSGDSLGAGLANTFPGGMSLGPLVGEEMGREVAARMRANPGSVYNVGGKPMGVIDGAPYAFHGLYGNKDPQTMTAMQMMDRAKRGAYEPWRGDVPYYRG